MSFIDGYQLHKPGGFTYKVALLMINIPKMLLEIEVLIVLKSLLDV